MTKSDILRPLGQDQKSPIQVSNFLALGERNEGTKQSECDGKYMDRLWASVSKMLAKDLACLAHIGRYISSAIGEETMRC